MSRCRKVVLLTDSELPLTVADTPVLSLSELMLVAMSAIEVPDAKARISEPRVPVISMVDALVWVPLIESVPVSADAGHLHHHVLNTALRHSRAEHADALQRVGQGGAVG
jgi:hypothetical protein